MITDTEIKMIGVKALTDALGEVNAERFISLIMREPFDYTKWQGHLWDGRSVEYAVLKDEWSPEGNTNERKHR